MEQETAGLPRELPLYDTFPSDVRGLCLLGRILRNAQVEVGLGGTNGAEKLERTRCTAMVRAPATAAGRQRAHATSVERGYR